MLNDMKGALINRHPRIDYIVELEGFGFAVLDQVNCYFHGIGLLVLPRVDEYFSFICLICY